MAGWYAIPEFDINIENVVAFASLNKRFDLVSLVGKLKDAEYDGARFPGAVYRIPEPRVSALLFSSGKIVCTGAKNIDSARVAVKKIVSDIRATGVDVPYKYDLEIENIVASTKIKADLNLEEIVMQLENTEYEPEQFPGLVYRVNEPRVAFLLFSSGKIICTGARKIEDIHEALAKFKAKMKEIGIDVKPEKQAK